MADTEQRKRVVEATGLTKVFKDFWGRPKARAVNGIDFGVRRGEVFGLLGPNGSGKSTTVKLILGLLYPTRGNLEVLGESARSVRAKRRIGYLPEETYLYKYLTAAETLDFFGALFEIPQSERRKRCGQLLDMVGLGGAENRRVGEFSKGMARRIGLAQALINDPDLVILDEPTSGLDPIGCREVKDLIRLLAGRGKTIILCSHLLADVEDVCDEVVVLYGGRIRAQGGMKEILTVSDKTQITAPRVDQAVLDEVLKLLRRHLGSDEAIHVDQPSMNLEEFFLDVVRKAKEASVETAGVQSGGGIADYLREGEQIAGEPTEKILSALTRGKEEEAAEEKTAEAEQQAAVQAEREEAEDRLSEMLQDDTASQRESAAEKPRVTQAEHEQTRSTEERREADERLKQLLGNQDVNQSKKQAEEDTEDER